MCAEHPEQRLGSVSASPMPGFPVTVISIFVVVPAIISVIAVMPTRLGEFCTRSHLHMGTASKSGTGWEFNGILG